MKWPELPFDHVLMDCSGGNPRLQTSEYRESGTYPVIDQGQREIAGWCDDAQMLCKVSLPCLIFGDHTKAFKYVDRPFVIGADGVKVLSATDGWSVRFLFYALQRAEFPTKESYERHYKYLKRTSIPSPPLPEQRRIADILDRADALRRQRKESLRLTEELLRSVFLEMFGDPVTNPKGWEVVPMRQLVAETQYGTSSPSNTDGVGIPVLRMNNITYEGRLDLRDLKYYDIPADEIQSYTVRYGDLLFNRTNSPELVGKTAVWDRHDNYAFAGYLFRVRFKPEIAVAEYVSAYLNSAYGKKYIYAHAKASNNMSNYSAAQFMEIPIPRADLTLQKQFAKFVKFVSESRSDYCQAQADLDTLFSSLLHRAFTGAL